ncbi:hypothetical protein M5D96_003889, partial [Drosophila gunungcola]
RILLILAVGGTSIRAARYKLEFEDPNIFSPCIDGPPGSIGIPDAFNMDNMVFDLDEEGVHVSGNLTTKWNFPRTDRISTVLKLYPFVLNLILENIRIPVSLGRYKTVFTLEAFDESEKRRPTSLCFEIKGQAAKMKD